MIRTQLNRLTAAFRVILHRVLLLPGRSTPASEIYPTDAPAGSVPGPGPLRMAVIGERAETSLGVLSHELGVAGFLARACAEMTGSGVRWSTTETASGQLREVPAALDGIDDLERIDVAVLMLGLTDAQLRTPVPRWGEQLRHTLDEVTQRLPDEAWILVAEIPLIDATARGARTTRALTSEHAHRLNNRTRDIVTGYARAITVADPIGADSARAPESSTTRYSRIHRVWGLALARAIAETGSAQ